jgi:DNA adenine methylase
MKNYVDGKVGPGFGYFGAKAFMARRINNLFQDHRVYTESFAGGLNVLLNKYRSEVEVVSDLNSGLLNFYKILVAQTRELLYALNQVPYSKETYDRAKRDKTQDLLQRAVNFLLIQRGGWSGVGNTWMDDPKRKNDWGKLDEKLLPVAERLQGVIILEQDALKTMVDYDGPDVTHYVDPPYYPATRVSPQAYQTEMSAFTHLKLLRVLNSLQGQVVLSGYDNIHYQEELKDWEKIEIDVAALAGPRKNGEQKGRRTEVLWLKNNWRF